MTTTLLHIAILFGCAFSGGAILAVIVGGTTWISQPLQRPACRRLTCATGAGFTLGFVFTWLTMLPILFIGAPPDKHVMTVLSTLAMPPAVVLAVLGVAKAWQGVRTMRSDMRVRLDQQRSADSVSHPA